MSKKLNKGLNGGFSPKDLGAARAFNKMTEEIFISDNNTNTNIQHDEEFNQFPVDHDEDLLDNKDIEDNHLS